MTSPKTLLDPASLAELNGLELRARAIVEGSVSGLHRSPERGYSAEFAEHREYSPGDDLRYIDWKAFGRTNRYHLKQFEDETNFQAWLAVDISRSMSYQSTQASVSKLEYARWIAAAVCWLAIRQRDAAGLVLFDNQIRDLIAASSQTANLHTIIGTLEGAGSAQDSKIGGALHELGTRLSRRSLIVVVSDMLEEPEETLPGLRRLRYGGHDVIVLHIVDPAEIEFPFDEPTLLEGLEHGGAELVEPRSLKAAYQEQFSLHQQTLQSGCRSLDADYALLRTDSSPADALARYLSKRAAQRARR